MNLEKRVELLEKKLLLVSLYMENSLEIVANTSPMNTMEGLYKLNDQYNTLWDKLDKEENDND